MAHEEREITIKVKYEPDMTSFVKKSRKVYYDEHTGEEIPKGSPYVELKKRQGPNIRTIRVSVATYEAEQAKYE